MKTGSRCKNSAGFTIVEVLIVLAVSGIMFVAAVILVSGRQGHTEFVTAINALQQELQQTVNETSNGFYPNNGDFTCTGSTVGSVTLQKVATGTAHQGTNSGCIFLGKAVQFGLGTGDLASQIGVMPLVGNQYQTDGSTPILTLTQSVPRAIYPAGSESTVPTTAALTDNLENGLTVATSNSVCGTGVGGMCYIAGTSAPVATGIVVFAAGDSSGNIASSDSSKNLQPGTEQYSLYAVSSPSTPNQSLAIASKNIGNNAANATSGLVSASSISICIASATDNQSGLITIDAGLNVSLKMKQGSTC